MNRKKLLVLAFGVLFVAACEEFFIGFSGTGSLFTNLGASSSAVFPTLEPNIGCGTSAIRLLSLCESCATETLYVWDGSDYIAADEEANGDAAVAIRDNWIEYYPPLTSQEIAGVSVKFEYSADDTAFTYLMSGFPDTVMSLGTIVRLKLQNYDGDTAIIKTASSSINPGYRSFVFRMSSGEDNMYVIDTNMGRITNPLLTADPQITTDMPIGNFQAAFLVEKDEVFTEFAGASLYAVELNESGEWVYTLNPAIVDGFQNGNNSDPYVPRNFIFFMGEVAYFHDLEESLFGQFMTTPVDNCTDFGTSGNGQGNYGDFGEIQGESEMGVYGSYWYFQK